MTTTTDGYSVCLYFFHLSFIVCPAFPLYKSVVLVFWGAYTWTQNLGSPLKSIQTMECMNPKQGTLHYLTVNLLPAFHLLPLHSHPPTPLQPHGPPPCCSLFLDLCSHCSFCLTSFSPRGLRSSFPQGHCSDVTFSGRPSPSYPTPAPIHAFFSL